MKTLLFVDDEPRVLQGLQRQLYSMRHEWKVLFAESGDEALRRMASTRVDVVVTDMIMPGMDGAEFLERVTELQPDAVRLVLSGHADEEAILRLVGPAHQYLSKPCNGEELKAAIERTLAMRELLGSQALRELVSRIPCLPSLPSLYNEITAELRRNEASVERIGEIISRDLAMTAKILQLANSAFFGLSHSVANIQEAVFYLGLATVRSLVLTVQIFSEFEGGVTRDFSIEELSRHCWKTAVFARRIGKLLRGDTKTVEHCFLGGLLHDVGHLILAAALPEQYLPLLREARASGMSIVELERERFGATHAEVGAHLLGLWGLPAPVIEAIALHHQPSACIGGGDSVVIAVHLADAFDCGKSSARPEPGGDALDLPHLAERGLARFVTPWRELCMQEAD